MILLDTGVFIGHVRLTSLEVRLHAHKQTQSSPNSALRVVPAGELPSVDTP